MEKKNILNKSYGWLQTDSGRDYNIGFYWFEARFRFLNTYLFTDIKKEFIHTEEQVIIYKFSRSLRVTN